MGNNISKKQILVICISLSLVITLASVEKLLGASFYEKKTLNIIVGGNPGGGYDRMARIMAKYLPNIIPGNPSVIINNMPGGPAGGMIATNYLYTVSKHDGYTIGTFNRYMPVLQLAKAEGVKYDLAKFAWIGATAVEASIFTIRGDLPYKTVDDLNKVQGQFFVGNTGDIDSGSQFIPVLKSILGSKLKFITYPSSSDVTLALERKEIDGFGFTYSTAKPWIDRGVLRPLMRGIVSGQGIENIPTNLSLITDEKMRAIINVLTSVDRVGRPYVGPPGFPVESLKILKAAFARVLKDPKVIEEGKRLKMDLEYVPADESLKIMNNVLNQPKNVVDELNTYLRFK